MPAGFYKPSSGAAPHKRFIIYGTPKSVKTPLAFAYGAYLRSQDPTARALYIAADTGSEDLPSLPVPEWAEWLDVWRMGKPIDKDPTTGKSTYDPYRDAIVAASTNWREKDPNYKLLIWDTLSMSCEEILQFIADMEFFAGAQGSKHITFGDPSLPKGHPAKLNIPLPGDYNGINGIAKRLVNCLVAQNMHVVAVCHEQEITDERGIKRIGPSFVGKALTGKLPGWLTGVLYTEKVGEIDAKTGKLVPTLYVCSDPADDLHIAGIRHKAINGDPRNPIGKVKVGADLTKYWAKFFETLFADEAAPVKA